MKVSMAQMAIKFEDKKFNMEKALSLFEKAAEEKTDFIIFPEMTLTGFSMHTERIGEDIKNSETIRFFEGCAKKYNMGVCFGMVRLSGEDALNSAVIMDKEGNVLGVYDKIHPFSGGHEAKFYKGGENIILAEFEGITLSPFICYDLRFPEIFQAASIEAFFLPVIGNWPKIRQQYIGSILKARAIENQSYACFVNTTGFDGKVLYGGGSVAFDPWGELIIEAGEEEGIYSFELDIDMPAFVRDSFKLRQDRRNDLYSRLYEKMAGRK